MSYESNPEQYIVLDQDYYMLHWGVFLSKVFFFFWKTYIAVCIK